MLFKHTSRKKIDILLSDTSGLECFKVVKCDVVKVGVADLFVKGVESTALNIYSTCQYAKRTHTLKNVVSVELRKFALESLFLETSLNESKKNA